jgi:hypothetical protein
MRFIIFMLFLSVLFSCKKENETPITTIEDKVINTGSKEPIDSVKVIAVDGVSTYDAFFGTSNNSGSGRYVITYTDINGKFNVSIKGNSPCIFLVKDGYRFVVFTYGSSENYKSYIAGNKYKNEVLELWADAYFKGVFKGLSCLITDSVYFDEGNFVESLENLRSRNIWWFGNGPFSPYYAWKGIGDKYFSYWMRYQVKGIWQVRLDSVFIKSFTTYTDTIYY